MKRRQPLDYLYLYQTEEESTRFSSGVEFAEFIHVHGPTNLLLVKHEYGTATPSALDPHRGTWFVIVEPHGIADLLADNPYRYGDFHLLDLPDLSVLDRLPQQEIAEILYLSHMHKPLSSPFLPGLQNSFAYLAHDDWWFTKSFFRDATRFYEIYGQILRNRIERIYGRKLPPLPPEITALWADWAREGLYIDLKEITKTRDEFTLSIYLLGPGRAPYSPDGPPRGIDDLMQKWDLFKQTTRQGLLRCHRRRWSAEV